MPVNPLKSTVLHVMPKLHKERPLFQYKFFDTILPRVKAQKDLGVLIDEDLSFNHHRLNVIRQCRRTIGSVKHSISTRDAKIMLKMFNSIIRPHLEYCCSVWCPSTIGDINMIEGVQRRFFRSIPEVSDKPYLDRVDSLSTKTLIFRRAEHDLVLVYKMLHNQIFVDHNSFVKLDSEGPGSRSTRGHSLKLFKPRVKKACTNKFWSLRIINIWNQLPREVVEASSVRSFKIGLERVRTEGLSKELDKVLGKISNI
jgi:hypothetical protein